MVKNRETSWMKSLLKIRTLTLALSLTLIVLLSAHRKQAGQILLENSISASSRHAQHRTQEEIMSAIHADQAKIDVLQKRIGSDMAKSAALAHHTLKHHQLEYSGKLKFKGNPALDEIAWDKVNMERTRKLNSEIDGLSASLSHEQIKLSHDIQAMLHAAPLPPPHAATAASPSAGGDMASPAAAINAAPTTAGGAPRPLPAAAAVARLASARRRLVQAMRADRRRRRRLQAALQSAAPPHRR